MKLDLEKIKKELDKDLKDPNGYWNTLKRKDEIKKNRIENFFNYLNKCDDSVILRILENGGEYQNYSNLIELLFDAIFNNLEPVKTITEFPPRHVRVFRNWYFINDNAELMGGDDFMVIDRKTNLSVFG